MLFLAGNYRTLLVRLAHEKPDKSRPRTPHGRFRHLDLYTHTTLLAQSLASVFGDTQRALLNTTAEAKTEDLMKRKRFVVEFQLLLRHGGHHGA